jgi:hypothetical protein
MEARVLRTVCSLIAVVGAAYMIQVLGSRDPRANARMLWADNEDTVGAAASSCEGAGPVDIRIQAAIEAARDGDEIEIWSAASSLSSPAWSRTTGSPGSMAKPQKGLP